jgi:hypothetical protein
MPVKMATSAPRPPFGLPELTVAVRTSLLSCRKAGKTRVFTPVRQPSEESRIILLAPHLRFTITIFFSRIPLGGLSDQE